MFEYVNNHVGNSKLNELFIPRNRNYSVDYGRKSIATKSIERHTLFARGLEKARTAAIFKHGVMIGHAFSGMK